MPTLHYNDQTFLAEESETVLDCLIRNNQKISHSCHSGICQSCVMKSDSPVDSIAQKGLGQSKKDAGLFLACQQKINKDLKITKSDDITVVLDAKIISQERLTSSVVKINIKPSTHFPFYAGQFINLIREDSVTRSYSIASQSNSEILELHIRKVPEGILSNWLYDEDLKEASIKISAPLGECYFQENMFQDELLLLGVGTGLAPLYGIIQDALAKGFKEKIALYHGALFLEGLYLVEMLKNLEEKYENFHYHPTFLKGEPREGFIQGDLIETIKTLDINKLNTTVMVCGDPEMVKKIKQTIFIKGVPSKKILSDPFLSAKK